MYKHYMQTLYKNIYYTKQCLFNVLLILFYSILY